jgi:hypothetical protein
MISLKISPRRMNSSKWSGLLRNRNTPRAWARSRSLASWDEVRVTVRNDWNEVEFFRNSITSNPERFGRLMSTMIRSGSDCRLARYSIAVPPSEIHTSSPRTPFFSSAVQTKRQSMGLSSMSSMSLRLEPAISSGLGCREGKEKRRTFSEF